MFVVHDDDRNEDQAGRRLFSSFLSADEDRCQKKEEEEETKSHIFFHGSVKSGHISSHTKKRRLLSEKWLSKVTS